MSDELTDEDLEEMGKAWKEEMEAERLWRWLDQKSEMWTDDDMREEKE